MKKSRKRHQYEIRMADVKKPFLDEIVASGAQFHMEKMNDNYYWLSLTWPNGDRLAWNIYAKNERAHVDAKVIETPGKAIHNAGKKH